VSRYVADWELTINEPLTGGTVSVVISAEQAHNPVVLKIHPPWQTLHGSNTSSAEIEAAAFRIWDGEGAPRLLASDSQALLLEHITPAQHSPDMTAQEVAALVTQTSRPMNIVGPGLTSLGIPYIDSELRRRYLRAEASRHEEISDILLLSATSLANYVTGFWTPGPWELVHGDFKTKNILKKQDGSFAVIDPSPAIGSRLYDVALWAIDEPESMLQRCAETADYLKVDEQIVSSLALVLAIPEICLASPARAQTTLECVRDIAGTNDLEQYFRENFLQDDFLSSYFVTDKAYGENSR
jgi:streptomycin 6-kinase